MDVFLIFPKSQQAQKELATRKISGRSGAEKHPEAALRHRAEAGTGRRSGETPEVAEVIHKQENGQTGF